MTLALALDALIILLLGGAIVFGFLLNRRLGLLRDSRGDLERAVIAINQSIAEAETGLAAIQGAAASLGKDLDPKVETARALAGELGYVVERGEAAALRLEQAISQSRAAIAGEPIKVKEIDDARRLAKSLRPSVEDVAGHREANDSAPASRGAALVRALRGMR